MYGLRHSLHETFKGAAEAVISPRKTSGFKEKGVLTPEEFVAAGDLLVQACPTWAWESGKPSMQKQYLPQEKQYLVTRNVPCMKRVAETEGVAEEVGEMMVEGKHGWLATHTGRHQVRQSAQQEHAEAVAGAGVDTGGEEIPEMDTFKEEEEMTKDEASATNQTRQDRKGNIEKTRTYSVSVTYDKYFQTPRVFLTGLDESKNPLSHEQMLEDVSTEHARKTVTLDPHPHTGHVCTSIHPCKHANVMLKLGENIEVEQYLLLFLKFVASILPTIEYDHTVAV